MKDSGTLGKALGMFLLVSALFAALLGNAPTSAYAAAGQKGNEVKGKFYFKQSCKSCHTKGEKGGELTPLSKTQAQWQAYFMKGKHLKGSEPLAKYWTPEQMNDARTFLYNHAVDSPQPETCGK